MSEIADKMKKAKSWTIGSLSKNVSKDGKEYRQLRLDKKVEIFYDGVKIPLSDAKVANLFQVDPAKKHPNLLAAEEKFNFQLTHDVSVKLTEGE